MTTSDAQPATYSAEEETSPPCFCEWLKRRRQELDLTQEQLARRASCSVFAIRKIELGERRPSRQLAALLAQALEIPAEGQAAFIKAARGELSVERLASPALAPRPGAPRENLPPANSPPANLPRALTPFVGREPELSALGRLLGDPQCLLLTIVGPGGIGKTRLAIEAAGQSRDRFPDGVWFVPLAALNSPALIVQAIADAVHFRFQDPTNPQAQLLHHLREKRALLILDNAEHLLEGAGLFAEILNACPRVKLLVTSRVRLNLLSEWVFEILGLPVPPGDQVEPFESYSSVALFLQSARRVRAGFELRLEERCWVLKICQIVEGLPLGIELSAAWVGMLSCEEIAREIERNFDFLTVSMRDLPERHRSLHATLDHSWNLLNPEEKRILSRLSVFRGSFGREAVKEICGASLAVLSSLRDKMLLYRVDQDFYTLHELVRQYAGLKLREDPDEDERVKDSHAAYYVGCLAEWEKALKGSRQVEALNEMARVADNLSRGWQRMVAGFQPQALKNSPFLPDRFHRSLFSLSLFYEMRQRSLEAIALLKESAAHLKSLQTAFENAEERALFYSVLGQITAHLGLHHIYILQNEAAHAYLEEAVGWLEKGPSRVERAQAQVMLSIIYLSQGQLQKTADVLEQSRQVFREEGDRWWYLLSIINLASPYISLRKLQESEALLQEGFGLIESGDLRLGLPLRLNYAYLLNLKKDFARAEQLLQESLPLSHQLESVGQTSGILFDLGRVTLATQRMEQAEAYFRKSIDILSDLEQFIDLSMNRLYFGKCIAARHALPAAREQFLRVIQVSQVQNNPPMVYWGLVSMAGTYLEEGQAGKALEIALAAGCYPVEFIRMKEDGDRLLADLRAALSEEQVDAARRQVEGRFSPDPSGASALAYAVGLVMEPGEIHLQA